jgi:hypothetical protein
MNLEDLKKEIPFKWRVQSVNQYNANCVAYIDARQVQDLLDEVCEPENWQCKYSEHKGNLFCSIGIRVLWDTEHINEDNWVWKSDCGTESNIEKQKGESSDAFKRAAVMWGVGRFLYAKDIIKLPVKEKNAKFLPYSEKTKKFVYGDDISKWCNALSKSK